jgi:hypothetical protein
VFQGKTDAKCCFRGSFWPQLALYRDRGKGYNARKGNSALQVSRAPSTFNPQPRCINHPPNMLILPGSNALSAFRSQRLLTQLQAVLPAVAAVQARYVHFIDAAAPLSADDTARLGAMLTYGDPAQADNTDGAGKSQHRPGPGNVGRRDRVPGRRLHQGRP